MGLIEILAVAAAIFIFIFTASWTVREAFHLFKTGKRVAGDTQSRVFTIMNGADAAQSRALALPQKAEYLRGRAMALAVSFSKLMVLIRALAAARRRLDPVLDYLGL